MSDEIKSDPPGDDATSKEEPVAGERPPPTWEYREEFRINAQMREMLHLAKKVTEAEIDRLRRKVEKLTYGS